jgi:hypothetical protein
MLRQRLNKKNGRKEWALVSKKRPTKILKWFGTRKPSQLRVLKEEKRVQKFKHMKSRARGGLGFMKMEKLHPGAMIALEPSAYTEPRPERKAEHNIPGTGVMDWIAKAIVGDEKYRVAGDYSGSGAHGLRYGPHGVQSIKRAREEFEWAFGEKPLFVLETGGSVWPAAQDPFRDARTVWGKKSKRGVAGTSSNRNPRRRKKKVNPSPMPWMILFAPIVLSILSEVLRGSEVPKR